MANYEIAENLGYEEEIRKLEPSDPAHADLFNSIFERIIRNVAFLKRNSVSHEELGIPEGESPSVENQVPAIPESPVKRENIADGDNMGTILAKVRKWLGDLKNVAFTGSYNDLSDKPSIPTVPGAIKNPHTLSVNGKSYDGAVAVEAGTIGIAYGGTGATTAASARTALGLGTASTQGTANNLTTTAAGYALDARQGKVLKDEIGQISSDLGGNQLIYNESEDAYYIQHAGADSGLKKLGKPKLPNTCTYTISMAVYKQSYGGMGVEKVTSGNCSVVIPWSVLRLMYDRVTISGASNGNGTYTQDTISDISVSWNGSSRSTYEVNLSGTITVTLESL